MAMDRTPEERELARAEREVSRAKKDGREPEAWALKLVSQSTPSSSKPKVKPKRQVSKKKQVVKKKTPQLDNDQSSTGKTKSAASDPLKTAKNVSQGALRSIKQSSERVASNIKVKRAPKAPSSSQTAPRKKWFKGRSKEADHSSGITGRGRFSVNDGSGGWGISKVFKKSFAVVFISTFVALIWFTVSLFQPFKGEGAGKVKVSIPQGSSAREIGDLLADRGVVSSGFFFTVRSKLSGDLDSIRDGSYTFKEDMSYPAALDTLRDGPKSTTITLTIPEGLSISEASDVVRNAGINGSYTDATKSSKQINLRRYGAPKSTDTLEGFLFPATYELPATADPERVVEDQVKAFKQRFSGVSLATAKKRKLTAYDVVTIASMIEREAQRDDERRKIAAVIYNRLKQGIPLGIDATIRYSNNNWDRPLTQKELDKDTPYNTRINKGLPPTPIGSPGEASLKAAANPASGNYLYYVVQPGTCGKHSFSTTSQQFEKDVQKYNQARQKNGGKSPTTC